MDYDQYIIQSILANNEFGITTVNELHSLKTVDFVRDEYFKIEKLIKNNDIEAIKGINENDITGYGFLDVMVFKDQNDLRYIVTVYDDNRLEQDPQIIKIYATTIN